MKENCEGSEHRFTIRGDRVKVISAGTQSAVVRSMTNGREYVTSIDQLSTHRVELTVTGMADPAIYYAHADDNLEAAYMAGQRGPSNVTGVNVIAENPAQDTPGDHARMLDPDSSTFTALVDRLADRVKPTLPYASHATQQKVDDGYRQLIHDELEQWAYEL